ncbi:MAG: Wzz/FepE/Etk N-terminal domain-containing protein [Chloroflexota bacterium]
MYLLSVIRRWFLVILLVVAVTGAAAYFRLSNVAPVYEATVKIQMTTPSAPDVALYDQYRSTNLRDDITVASNNFMELLQSREIYDRTINRLELTNGDAAYSVDATPLRDSDFIYITVRASTPQLAEEIANTTVSEAVAYYGEVSSKPTTAAGNSIRAQLQSSEKQFRTAEEALAEFQNTHHITSLENELDMYKTQLEQLTQARNSQMMQGLTTTLIESMIAQRREDLQAVQTLAPEYNVLEENAKQARAGYQLLLNKYQEAVLKEDSVKAASFVQIVEQASAPDAPAPTKVQVILLLAVGGSLGFGILLALLLDSLRKRKPPIDPANTENEQRTDHGDGDERKVTRRLAEAPMTATMETQSEPVSQRPWFRP